MPSRNHVSGTRSVGDSALRRVPHRRERVCCARCSLHEGQPNASEIRSRSPSSLMRVSRHAVMRLKLCCLSIWRPLPSSRSSGMSINLKSSLRSSSRARNSSCVAHASDSAAVFSTLRSRRRGRPKAHSQTAFRKSSAVGSSRGEYGTEGAGSVAGSTIRTQQEWPPAWQRDGVPISDRPISQYAPTSCRWVPPIAPDPITRGCVKFEQR